RWRESGGDERRATLEYCDREPGARSEKTRDYSMSERSDARAPLSVLVLVKNEAANLRDCLASVSFAEEIVVVDSASTDGTQAIAEAAGARVVQCVGDNILSGDNEVHEHILLNGRAEYLSAPMDHYAFPDIATFIEKHDRYSTWEAAASGKLHEGESEKTLRATPFGTAVERKRWLKKLAMKAPF